MEERRTVGERPRIGLALGGGGARGYAHLGVLNAFREAGIPIDVIVGTSMGAVVGAAYTTGYRIDELIDIALQMRWRQLLSLADPKIPRQGVIAGNRLEKYFAALTGGGEFKQLEKTLIIVATDIATGTEVRINTGPLARALRASTAVPGIFCPVKSGRHLLVDGSITTPVPTEAALGTGAAVVVAVDVCSSVDRTDVLMQAWKWWKEMPARQTNHLPGTAGFWRFLKPVLPESVKIVSRSLDLVDRHDNISSPLMNPSMRCLLLRPAVEDVRWYEFHRVRECIQTGEAAGREVVDQINALLETGDFAEKTGH